MPNLFLKLSADPTEPNNQCPTKEEVNQTLSDANQALEKVANGVFEQETLDSLVDSTIRINTTVGCVNDDKLELTADDKLSLQVSIKQTKKTKDQAEDTIDSIINPTPEPLPGLELNSPFMITLITLSCLLAAGTLVGLAMAASRSLRAPPQAGRRRPGPRPTASGRINAGYRPADTDTTELVERPAGERHTAPAAEPGHYGRMYEGAIPRAHAADRPWSGEPQPPPRREFYNAY